LTVRAFRLSPGLKVASGLFLVVWSVIAAFPLVWTALMSFRLPLDALSSDPMAVLLGPVTLARAGGLSVIDLVAVAVAAIAAWWLPARHGAAGARLLAVGGMEPLGWVLAALLYAVALGIVGLLVLPPLVGLVETIVGVLPLVGGLARPVVGFTGEHYEAVWIARGFHKEFVNSITLTVGVVVVSLSVGTLAGYGLARARTPIAFWILVTALIFRALPHSVLVAGYLPPFLNSHEILQPLWEMPVLGPVLGLFSDTAPTLYGQPWAVVLVLVAINQPFTIWMLRSFFLSVPTELDEAARVDGCSQFGAFWRVIVPVMWPGVITTGLFSFLLAYNDYLVTSLLLDQANKTMVPAISQFLGSDNTTTDQIQAVAAAVSVTAPLFLLVMVFQRQIVSGLTLGAVKG